MSIKTLLCFLFLTGLACARTTDSLITDLRIRWGQTDSTNTTLSNTQLRRCLNMAQNALCLYSGAFQKLDTIPGGNLRMGTSQGLNTDFAALRQTAWLFNGSENKPIPYIPSDSLNVYVKRNDPQVQGENRVITEDGGGLAVYPKVLGSDSLVISYFAYARVLSGTVECDLSNAWEEVLISAALELVYENANNGQMVSYYAQEKDRRIAILRGLTTDRPQVGAIH